ncbi:MAG TPA: DUF748 domain-containing protein, partial [Flavobacteriales bacterium]|nr:DUF748 domain-containing protein [Flavobacteriales bacterium]
MVSGTEQGGRRRKWRRRLIIGGVLVAMLLLVVAFLLPWLLKRYIEEHSEEWIHRKVRIERIILNPFTFTYAVSGVTVHEPGSDQVFVSWDNIRVKADLWKAFRRNDWHFHHVRIVRPYVRIAQHKDRFNFSDLLELGGSEPKDSATSAPVRFSLEDIRLADGRVVYAADLLKEPAGITDLDAACTRITGESTRMDFDLSFALAQGGALKGGFMIDTEHAVYAIDAGLTGFALPQLLPYLQDLMHTNALTGLVDLDLHLRDSWVASDGLAVRADLGLRDLGVTDANGEPLVGIRSARVKLDTLDARSDRFDLTSVAVDGFSTRFQLWPDGSDTWSRALKLDTMAAGGDTTAVLTASSDNIFVMLADWIRTLGRDLVANEYNADSLAITNAELVFEDHTPERPFRYVLNDMVVRSSRMNSGGDSLRLGASATLNGRGQLSSSFAFDPQNLKNVDAMLQVSDLALADLDAYGRWYAAHPLEEGTLDYMGRTRIADGRLNSANHLRARGMQVGKKVDAHDPGIVVLPLRLGVGLLKDVRDFISDAEAKYLPADQVLYICTGSQGEPRAAIARIAEDQHPHVSLEPGDLVIFSSKTIPGNEKEVSRVLNNLARLDIDMVTGDDDLVHSSGHPRQGELALLYAAFTQGLPSPLPELSIQYADFAAWQRQWLQGDVLARQLHYWQEQLAGVPPLLALPTDRPRPALETFQGS